MLEARPADFDATPASVARQQHFGESTFPIVFQSLRSGAKREAAVQWIEQRRDELLGLAAVHGAVLLRGFPFPTPEDFDVGVAALALPNFPYRRSLSNAVRINRTERVFSANEAPPTVQIFLHHEMAQTPLFPRWIMFHCEVAATSGGATPICRSDVLYTRLAADCPEFASACEAKGLKYTNVMPDSDDLQSGMGRSWRSTLGVDAREGAEQRLRELGYSWEWLSDGCLRATTPPLPAVRVSTGSRKVFFNQLIAAFSGWRDRRNDPSKAVRHGDDTPLDATAVSHAIELAEQLMFDVAWEAGDMAIVDNTLAMHARRTFVGPRKVWASLASMETQQFVPWSVRSA